MSTHVITPLKKLNVHILNMLEEPDYEGNFGLLFITVILS